MRRMVLALTLSSALAAGPAAADSIGEIYPYFEVCVPADCALVEQPAQEGRLFNIACNGSPYVAVAINTSGYAHEGGLMVTDIPPDKTTAWPLTSADPDTVGAIMDSFRDPRREDNQWDMDCAE